MSRSAIRPPWPVAILTPCCRRLRSPRRPRPRRICLIWPNGWFLLWPRTVPPGRRGNVLGRPGPGCGRSPIQSRLGPPGNDHLRTPGGRPVMECRSSSQTPLPVPISRTCVSSPRLCGKATHSPADERPVRAHGERHPRVDVQPRLGGRPVGGAVVLAEQVVIQGADVADADPGARPTVSPPDGHQGKAAGTLGRERDYRAQLVRALPGAADAAPAT